MKIGRWVLFLPFLVFSTGVGLFVQTETEARVLFERAKRAWRSGHYQKAAAIYRTVSSEHGESSFAARALWELAQLNYVNRYDIESALAAFQKLAEEKPHSPLAAQGFLMLADIHEKELRDLEGAITYWKAFLGTDPPAAERQPILFRIGDAYFKLAQLPAALETFQTLIEAQPADSLYQQTRLRLGMISQLRQDYEESLEHFLAVLERGNQCQDCRLQAQLALIESYEFLDQLPQAIEVARSIDEADYPGEMKAGLLARLNQKQSL